MQDGPPGDLTTSERLDLLRKYETSWKNFEWSERNSIPSESPLLYFYGNVLAWRSFRGGETIDFRQLPSRLRGVPMRQSMLRLAFYVQDFGMDISQDLLVMIECVEKYVWWPLSNGLS